MRDTALAVAVVLWVGDCWAAGGTATDQAVSLTYPSTHWSASPVADLLGVDPSGDPISNAGWWYRTGTDAREYPLPAPDSESYIDGEVVAVWNNLDGKGFEVRETTWVFDHEAASGGFVSSLVAKNLNAVAQDLTVFHYLDVDLAGTSVGDYGSLQSPGRRYLKFVDGTSSVWYRSHGPDHFAVAAFPSLRASLQDSGLTSLSDGGLPFGPGDVSAAYQFGPSTYPSGAGFLGAGEVSVMVRMPADRIKGAAGLYPYPQLHWQSSSLSQHGWTPMRRATQLGTVSAGGPAGDAVAGVDDFDGDYGERIVYRNPVSGQVWLDWEPLSGAPTLPLNWKLAATGDFNHDGRADILWRNTTSQKLVVWTMNGSAKIGSIIPSPDQAVDANWEVAAAADFNGDSHRDLLWYNQTTGKIVLWFMNGSVTRITGQFTSPASVGNNNWKVLAAGDFGRGLGGAYDTQDVVWQNDTSKKVVVWYMDQSGNRTSGTFVTPDTLPLTGDLVGPR